MCTEHAAVMRVFAVSDIHIDYPSNARWVAALSTTDYRDDVLILAGDVSDCLATLEWCFGELTRRFKKVLFVPGNHELWVIRDGPGVTSFDKFDRVCRLAQRCDVSMRPFHHGGLSIVPLLGWYDYSFGPPAPELVAAWADYHVCRWPSHFTVPNVAARFLRLNEPLLAVRNTTVISFSHFLPRIDIMPGYVSRPSRIVYPVLGTMLLERQIRLLQSTIHVYGHSHVNRNVKIDGVTYVNNAFGYPREVGIASKELMCVHEL